MRESEPDTCERCLDTDGEPLYASQVKVLQNGQDVWVDMWLCDGCFSVLEDHEMARLKREPQK